MASDSPRRPGTCSSFRRRRVLLLPALLLAFFLFSRPWSSPPLNLSGISSSLSRASIVSLVKGPPVEEIYGLLHFVTSDDERMLSYSVDVDPDEPIDLTVYLGDDQPIWSSHMKKLREEYPLIVFSKVCVLSFVGSHGSHAVSAPSRIARAFTSIVICVVASCHCFYTGTQGKQRSFWKRTILLLPLKSSKLIFEVCRASCLLL